MALSRLFVGLECGRSDPSSGLVANPLIGRVADALVDLGARVVFGETLEWLRGAPSGETRRVTGRGRADGAGRAVAGTTRSQPGRRSAGQQPRADQYRRRLVHDRGEIAGAIAKSGSRPIAAVLSYGEGAGAPGLYAMDAPAYAPESLSGFVAAGAQLLLFSTGVGNSYVSALAPTIKLSANPLAAQTLHEQLDFDASRVFLGGQSLDEAAQQLMALLADIASGTMTWGRSSGKGMKW